MDYESEDLDRTDEANDYMYRFLAIATDPSGETGMATVTIHVLDVDEAPEVTGPAALTYFENTLAADNSPELRLDRDHGDDAPGVQPAAYTATDNDLDDDGTITPATNSPVIQWQLKGDDASKFQFVGSTDDYTNSASVTSFEAATATVPVMRGSGTSPELQFRSPPDLEVEGDKDKNNVYEIEVVAWDGGLGDREQVSHHSGGQRG